MTKLSFSMRGKRLALAAGCAAMLASCGGGGSSSGGSTGVAPTPTPTPSPAATTSACSLRSRQDWALAQLNEWYLFPELLSASTSPSAYTTVHDYIDALVAPARAQNRDRYFTYLTSIAEEDAYYAQGQTAGFGMRLGYDTTANRLFVIEAFEGGNALAANVDRGTELLQINGQSVSSLMAAGGPQAVVDAMGPDTAGTSRSFIVRDLSGAQRTVSIAKSDFLLDPVSNRFGTKIIDDGGRRVGYVNLRTFIAPANQDLRDAFAQFKAQGVTDLIIDLRYNGGGAISVAELFGDLLGGGRAGQIFDHITFRPSKAINNSSYAFHTQPESISPTKIAFIGTRGTASASEMLINGMLPYLGTNMALVGTNTYGKPVGQIAQDRAACDDRLRIVALKTENANRQGEYFNGLATTLPVTCRANDDIGHQLGDPNEGMVRAALDYIAGRSCTAIGATTTQAISGRRLLTPEAPKSTVQWEVPGAY